jgi:hypothetical protein
MYLPWFFKSSSMTSPGTILFTGVAAENKNNKNVPQISFIKASSALAVTTVLEFSL